MRSKLLPRHTQVATPKDLIGGLRCSNFGAQGSRWVAGWVAGCLGRIRLSYAVFAAQGSKGSRFFKNLRTREKREIAYVEDERRIRITIGTSCYTCYPGHCHEAYA